ncbi:MAG TPA: sigma 54-interacting transcriptional regulator, partial [Clostridia bacterium]|nr:sigma 54-interacting transcriptional regulator [Clostridia bacterium]
MEYTYQAWEGFVKGSKTEIDFSPINPRILASWERCVNRDQDPETLVSLKVPDRELEIRRSEKHELVQTTKPFMKELYEFVKGSGFVVVLLDQDACILDLLGDSDVFDKYPHFRVGEIWDEETKGTNAMGLVRVEKVPLQVYATEHYVRGNHTVTCSAAPIWGENGKMAGILDVSGDYKQAHAHTLGMVVAAVKAIQNELGLKAANTQIINSFYNVSEVLETLSDGIVSFDKDGFITTMNPMACQILNIKRPDYMGRSFKEILKNNDLFLEVLHKGRNVDNREFFIQSNRKQAHFLLSACPIIDHKDDICGGVANIREIQTVHQLVHKVVGARALLHFQDIIGESKSLKEKIKMARDIAPSGSSVVLQGESGTGKEMFAQSIHNASSYSAGPFIAINCAAIPRDLIESELFGYEEGAFTGAKRGGNAGKFELASGGTIFLDEIGDMPLDTQATLLRTLQDKQIVRVGGYRPIRID